MKTLEKNKLKNIKKKKKRANKNGMIMTVQRQ